MTSPRIENWNKSKTKPVLTPVLAEVGRSCNKIIRGELFQSQSNWRKKKKENIDRSHGHKITRRKESNNKRKKHLFGKNG